MKNQSLNIYKTKDLAKAVFIYASGKKLNQTDNLGGTVFFVFEDRQECEALADAFWRSDAAINAAAYASAFRRLKILIFRNH